MHTYSQLFHETTDTYTFSRVTKRILQSNFELRPHIGGSFKPYTSRLTHILVTFIRNNVTNVFRRLGFKELGWNVKRLLIIKWLYISFREIEMERPRACIFNLNCALYFYWYYNVKWKHICNNGDNMKSTCSYFINNINFIYLN